jgi:pimeloyl-ACP methyl ester carboxylesterase
MMKRTILAAFAASAFVAGLTLCAVHGNSTAAPRAQTPPRLALQPCKVSGVEEELLCGRLPVYENRRTMRGRQILLNVVVLPALEAKAKAEPLFHIEGGPGNSATAEARDYATVLKLYRRDRDVVLVDQRGTGGSNPLRCPDEGFDPQAFMDDMYPPAFVRGCRRALEQRADLTQYTTSDAMDDLDDVRAALGYDRINLIGISYGTRAAMEYVRRHPSHVRAVVLMGAAPVFNKMPLYHARAAQRAMELLFDDCAADAACRRAFPNLRAEFKQLIEKLERQPARVLFKPKGATEEREFVVRRGFFADHVRSRMYLPPGAAQVPYLIHRAALGDFRPFLSFALPTRGPDSEGFSGGMYLSVTCSEDVPRIRPSEIEPFTKGTFLGDYRVFQQRRACKLWPKGDVPESFYEPVAADAPVLIIAGRLDPVTPPEWADQIARTLPNGKVVRVAADAHLPVGINFDCMDELIVRFINQASAKGLDFDACAAQIKFPPFQTEAAKAAGRASN